MLDIQKLEKSFGDKRAVQGLSFTVEKGTVLGFLGPNGAGKSTTMRMIAGVLEPDTGDAMIDGIGINLFANLFTISGFPQWYPFGVVGVNYQEADETTQFRFSVEQM